MNQTSRSSAVLLTAIIVGLLLISAGSTASAQKPEFSYGFEDTVDHWAEDTIEIMYRSGIVTGTTEEEFSPDNDITRLDFTRWLVRSLGAIPTQTEVDFEDAELIPEEALGEIAYAVDLGLIQGYPDGTFRPEKTVTRVQMATILGRVLMELGIRADGRYFHLFDDGDEIPEWAVPADAAIRERIVIGREVSKFAPFDTTTRAEATKMLHRFMTAIADLDTEEIVHPPELDVTPPDRYLVAGYYMGSDPYRDRAGHSYQTLKQNSARINLVIMSSYSLHIENNEVVSRGYDSEFVFEQAQANNHQEALVRFTNADFDRNVASTILNDPEHRAHALETIEEVLRKKPYAGVDINFENVDPQDRDALSEFMSLLWRRLGNEYLITMAVPAKMRDNPNHGWSGAFDYEALHPSLDYMIIMAYDQHWSTSAPGPVASISWVRSIMNYTVSVVPPDKVLMGAPFYGYDWEDTGKANRATGRLWTRALEIAHEHGVEIQWDEAFDTPFFRYTTEDGTDRIVYFENERSLELRLDLLEEFGVAGVAFWRFGQESPDAWRVINRVLD